MGGATFYRRFSRVPRGRHLIPACLGTVCYVRGERLPALAVAGGFTFEDQIYKGFARGAPFVKLVGMARGPIAAAMVGKTIGEAIEIGDLPVYVEQFG